MSIVTITPSPDPRWSELKPITLNNPTQAQLSDIIKTFTRNDVKYTMTYEKRGPFKYHIAPTFISR